MSHLLIISLGPIQDFIAAARRCRDLWFGSWLLSELSKAVAKGVCDKVELKNLVFPGVQCKSELESATPTSVANKIVAIVPDAQDPEDVAEAGRNALTSRLNTLASAVFHEIQKCEGNAGYFQRDTAEKQLNDFIEFLWVGTEIKSDYPAARKQAEALLAQRKRTLLWGLPTWDPQPGIPKSSLDGQRESVIHENIFAHVKKNPQLEGRLRRVYGVKPNERLCGVGLLKRLGERKDYKDHRFLSTPHLASMPLVLRMRPQHGDIRPSWKKYLDKLKELGAELDHTSARWEILLDHYDGKLLFETRLDELFDNWPKEERPAKIKGARDALEQFLKKDNKLPRPLPYYAILMADGDRMGEVIKHRDSIEEHQKLSQALDSFAQNARNIVEEDHFGELIYSGGDDVLAFVPLNKAIECAQALREDFAKNLEQFATVGATPSLSVGIGICHFMDPMGDAFKLARQAEKKAKEKRNSLAIIVDKRSGPSTVVFGQWDTVDKDILKFVEWHRRDHIPDGVAFELQELNGLLHGADEGDIDDLRKLVDAETKRILGRKRAQKGEKDVDEKIKKELQSVSEQLAERLIVARLIAQAKDIAEGELKKETA